MTCRYLAVFLTSTNLSVIQDMLLLTLLMLHFLANLHVVVVVV